MKLSKSIRLKNAMIDLEHGTVTETSKDDIKVYTLQKILKEWDKIDGVSITISKDDDVPSEE